MANVTITGNFVNHDSAFCTGLANGETYTINNGGRLTIDSDPAWSFNNAFPGNITINNGRVIIDGTRIKNIYYTNPVGSFPPLNTVLTGVLSNATGEICYTGATFKRVANTGFFKIREQFGNFINNEPIRAGSWSGNLSGNSQTGWIHFVGTEGAGFVTARNGAVVISGAWYQLGVSNGNANQIVEHYCQEPLPVVWVEKSSGSNEYDMYLNAGTRWPNGAISSGERGYWFRHSGNVYAGGTGTKNILFGANTFASPGKIPPSGCRIKVPNIHFSATTTTAWAGTGNSLISSTLGTRYDFNTASAGDLYLNTFVGGGFNLNSNQAVNVDIRNAGFFDQVAVSETANRLYIDNVGVGMYEANDNLPLQLTTLACPVSLYNIKTAHRDAGNNESSNLLQNCLNVNGNNLYLYSFRSNAGGNALAISSCDSINLTGLKIVGGRTNIISSNDISLNNTQFSSEASGANTTSLAQSLFEINTRSTNITIDGLSGLESNLLTTYPRTAFVNIANSSFINLRNFGTTGGFLNASSNTTYIYSVGTQTTDVNLNRIYCNNTATNISLDTNTDTRLVHTNVWGDVNDTLSCLSLNSKIRGGRIGSLPALGQTAVYGTHFYDVFQSGLSGRIGVFFNEKTEDSLSVDAYTISGNTKFDSLGGLLLLDSGDSIEYTWPHFILGYSGFHNMSGRGFFVQGVAGNQLFASHRYEYSLNTGLGFSAYQLVSGNITGHRFSPTVGVKPKLRFTCVSGSQTNRILGFHLLGMTDPSTSLEAIYPMDSIPASLNLTNLITGTEIRVFNSSNDNELAGVESSDTSFTYDYIWEGTDITSYIVVHSLGYVPIRYNNQVLGRNGLSIEIQQQTDRVYENL
jgi:hypothetical protein